MRADLANVTITTGVHASDIRRLAVVLSTVLEAADRDADALHQILRLDADSLLTAVAGHRHHVAARGGVVPDHNRGLTVELRLPLQAVDRDLGAILERSLGRRSAAPAEGAAELGA